MEKPTIDHVALLVGDIDQTLCAWSLQTKNKVDEFADIGTKELYVENEGTSQKLLLMQAVGPGPYREAFEKRGPGLHHIAFHVSDLDAFLPTVEKSGWLLHPKSLRFYKSMKQVYLCRPDVPVLIELGEGNSHAGPKYIEKLKIQVPAQHRRLFKIFDTDSLEFSDTETTIRIAGKEFCLDRLKKMTGGSTGNHSPA